MNKVELKRVLRLGLKTVGDVGKYLHLMKINHNELEILSSIRLKST